MSWMVRKMLASRGLLMNEETGGEGSSGGSVESEETQEQGNKSGESKDVAEGSGEQKSKITDAEAKLLKEVMDKKSALKRANDELAQAKARLSEFDGVDPAEIKALIKERKEAEVRQLEAKGEWDRLKAQMAEEHGKEKASILQQVESIREENNTLKKTIAELTVGNAFAQSKFINEELEMTPSKTRIVYGSHFETVDGKVVAYDKPAGEANRTMLVDSQGDPLDFESAMRKIIEADPDRDRLIRSKVRQGAGSKTAPKTSIAAIRDSEPLVGQAKIAAALSKGILNKKA